MRFALGCAFTTKDILYNFPYKKLSYDCNLCKSVTGDNHRNILVEKVFKESVRIIILDIIKIMLHFGFP